MHRLPPRSTLSSSSAASDVYKRQPPTTTSGGGGGVKVPIVLLGLVWSLRLILVSMPLANGGSYSLLEYEYDPYSALIPVSYTHLRAHETPEHLVCRLLLEKKKHNNHA
eukprot:TRINITY_DN31395_c0_g1_i1.p1 TRINITY_DN31395_c0_g1~~TRINITY_DN31395_c0_g1_i1.p1  ORF type:complete len:109 (+),score=21.81 TRINITY_DN31395_c0_g1_i1:59-385(+)